MDESLENKFREDKEKKLESSIRYCSFYPDGKFIVDKPSFWEAYDAAISKGVEVPIILSYYPDDLDSHSYLAA